VFNFVTLKRIMKRLADELDHRMLLRAIDPLIAIEPPLRAGYRANARRWYRFRGGCGAAATADTTVEMLARHLAAATRRARPRAAASH